MIEARQALLTGFIDYLGVVQQITSNDVVSFYASLMRPNNDDEATQSHTKQLLADALHERDCLNVVIAILKDELEWEEWEAGEEC